jgi:radical SAM protein (TIGR01212 family)
MPVQPFRDYASFLSSRFEGKVQKLSVNGGFGCPNRDGTLGTEGCRYCNNASFTPPYCRPSSSIREQLEAGKRFFSRKYPRMKYLAYFQSYSNTYAPPDVLRSRYEEALAVPEVVGIIIGTRPDCVSPPVLQYLQELSHRTFVLVEYGVETTSDALLASIGRGHTFAQAAAAIRHTAERGIPVAAHIILGLPGQSLQQMMEEPARLSALPIDILKLHQLQIVRGSAMAADYALHPGRYTCLFPTPRSYAEVLMPYLQRLRPDMVVERFTSQSPSDLLIAPRWGM